MKLGISETFLHRIVDVDRSRDGRRLSRTALESRYRRQRGAERRRAFRRRARWRPAEARRRDRTGCRLAWADAVGRRSLQALRHVRPSARFHRRSRGRKTGRRRPRGLRTGDGGPARESAREECLRRQEGAGIRVLVRPGPAGPERRRRSLRGLHDHDRQRYARDRALRQGTAPGERAAARARTAMRRLDRRRSTSRRAARCPMSDSFTPTARARQPMFKVWPESRRACRGCTGFT